MKSLLKLAILFIGSFLMVNCGNSPDQKNDSPSDPILESRPDTKEESNAIRYSKIIPSLPMDKYLIETDIDNLSPTELREIRNEYYARRGYIFKNKELGERFTALGYSGRHEDVTRFLTKTDKRNIRMIRDMEKLAEFPLEPLAVNDFEGINQVSIDFRKFLEDLLKVVEEGNESLLSEAYAENENSVFNLKMYLKKQENISGESTISYSVYPCDPENCLVCEEGVSVHPDTEAYRVMIMWKYEEAEAGRSESAVVYMFARVGDSYKAFCSFAAG